MILKGDFVDVTAVLIDKYFSGKNQIGVLVYIGGFVEILKRSFFISQSNFREGLGPFFSNLPDNNVPPTDMSETKSLADTVKIFSIRQ